jgi:hypothetical protein
MLGVQVELDLLDALRRLADKRETSVSSEARRGLKNAHISIKHEGFEGLGRLAFLAFPGG